MPLIQAEHITKEYKRNVIEKGLKGALKNMLHTEYEVKTAIDDISLEVDAQETVGYIGSNGSGKSTTIKMLTGILTPTRGKIIVDGLVPYENRIQNNYKIGAIFGQRSQLWWDIPVINSYRLVKKLYEVDEKVFQENLEICANVLEIKDLLQFSPRQLSLGQKMRCELGSIMLYNPRIIFLDEPTIGLDVHAKEKIRNFIRRINQEKKTTIFLTSHDFQDIEDICERVIVLDHGHIVWDGSKAEMKEKFSQTRMITMFVDSVTEKFTQELEKMSAVTVKDISKNQVTLECDIRKTSPLDVIRTANTMVQVNDIEVKGPTLESIIKQYFK